jgi:hypothetical protein
MAKATSISAASLGKFTQAAVKDATLKLSGKLTIKGPTMGFILQQDLGNARALTLATTIADGVASNARAAGVVGLKPKPVVIRRPGSITVGFIAPEIPGIR